MQTYKFFQNVFLALSTLVTVGLTTTGSTIAKPLYSLTDLDTLPGDTSSYATNINNFGQVIGNSGESHAFIYDHGQLTEIKPLPGDNGIAVTGINNFGEVVGNSANTDKFTGNNPLLYRDGETRELAPLKDSIPYAINDKSQIVGGGIGIGAFLYSNGKAVSLGSLAPVAYNINNKSEVIGVTENNRAFLYQNGTIIDIGTLSGDRDSAAYGINNSGTVVGYSAPTGIDDGEAFLYSRRTGIINLGRLLPTDTYSVATGINNCGDVVGFSGKNNNFYSTNGLHAFLYINGKLRDLNDLIPKNSGFTLTAATAINDWGEIVGRGSVNGQLHAFLLTPKHKNKYCDRDSD